MTNELVTRLPFAFARSALFRPAERRHETFFNAAVASADDYKIEINYSGPELTPIHGTAWQAVVALAFQANKGVVLPISTRLIDILRAMGHKSIQTHAKRWLRGLLADLAQANLSVTTPRQHFSGPLLALVESGGLGKITIHFPAGTAELLANEVVLLPMASKGKLTSYPLASWLHDYVATHRSVYELPVVTLHRLCGSCLTTAMFRQRLRLALDQLKASGDLLESYDLAKGMITLRKKTTRVVLLPSTIANAQRASAGHEARSNNASNVRTRVPL